MGKHTKGEYTMAKKTEPAAPVKSKHELLMEEVAGLEVEYPKIVKGNKAAGARYRKHISNIAALGKEARKESLELAPAA